VAAVAAVFGLNVILAGIETATGGSGPKGPRSSSYATSPGGLAAYADLLAEEGHPVTRLRVTLEKASLRRDAALVLADPGAVTPEENRRLAVFVRNGGRLVAAGPSVVTTLREVVGTDLRWLPGPGTVLLPLGSVPEVAGVVRVESAGLGSWADYGEMQPILGSGDRVVALATTVGKGRVVALADSSVLQNRLLDHYDDAAFGLAVAGPSGAQVSFAEAQHGFGIGSGLAALPDSWRTSIFGMTAAVLIWIWAKGSRFGSPEEVERELAPARLLYVEALASTLARTRQPSVAGVILQAAGRRRAGQLGVDDGELSLPVIDDEDLLDACRTVSRLESR